MVSSLYNREIPVTAKSPSLRTSLAIGCHCLPNLFKGPIFAMYLAFNTMFQDPSDKLISGFSLNSRPQRYTC